MTAQTLKIKKKKKVFVFDTDFLTIQQEDQISQELQKRVLKIFKTHIGIENAIQSVDLFIQVYGIHPAEMQNFKRDYWWKKIRIALSSLRKQDIMFTVKRGNKWFVLCTKQEAKDFKTNVRRHIKYLENLMDRADNWVDRKKWKNI